jgi:hypothetical protein
MSAIVTHAPADLWQTARDFLNLLFNLFGGPEDIAFRHTLTTKPHRLLRDWIRAGEAFMRRLLLIEASFFPKPNTRPLLRPLRKRVRKLMHFEAEQPEHWRVSFRCLIAERRLPAGKHRSRSAPSRFHSAWPLAERYEALLRVFNNPAPYARRLARRLYATPHRVRELTAHPESAPGCVGAVAFERAGAECKQASKRFEPG